MELIKLFHYYVMPILFLITTPICVQYLAYVGQDEDFTLENLEKALLGNQFSWTFTLIVYLWAIVWLKIPSRITYGPPNNPNQKSSHTEQGNSNLKIDVPKYKDNGYLYYCATIIAFIWIQSFEHQLCVFIFKNMPQIIGSLNISAFMLCLMLYFKGIHSSSVNNESLEEMPKIFLFYSGIELYPSVFGIQIKQLTNCRIGLILWQILVLAFFICTYNFQREFNPGAFVNCILQTVYLVKFYWWESGYFWTLDMMYDNAGYYICWGCLVFVPMFYTFSSYYLVHHPPTITVEYASIILIVGLIAIVMNYRVDYEKQIFKKHIDDDDFKLWGKRVDYIPATFIDARGETTETKLLTSGCWGVARHLNYLFELILCYSLCATGYGLGIYPFLYPIFLTVLLINRCYRDESRCLKKYGDAYREYCRLVPYRIIPYVY